MSKAIEGAAEIGAAIAMGVAAFYDPVLIANPYYVSTMFALGAGGIGMEAAAIAGALTTNPGMNITTRTPAAPRQFIYGMQRVGGVTVYRSTTGSSHNQYNYVIVLANHVCAGIEALYLDGRKVNFVTNFSHGTTTGPDGVTVFGGDADGNTYTGPNGVQYNFGGKVYCEAYYGNQTNQPNTVAGGGFSTGLQANDGNWAPTSYGTPYLGGCTYVYLKVEYDPGLFPGEPEIRFTMRGKMVYDPRTGTTGFSSNPALICADWASDVTNGLGLQVNQAQLIAAANVCDEQVYSVGAAGYEARYACHYHFDTLTPPSDVYNTLLMSMGGRRSLIGGEEYLCPAFWQGPSFNFGPGDLTAAVQWDSTATYADNCNRITGTYVSPNYPYNVAGNLYDKNGFFEGEIQNNFQAGFTQDNFPQYAQDQLHGYAADQWLNEDSGVSAAWDDTTSFALGQVVSYTQVVSGTSYASVWRSLIASNVGNTPEPTSTAWVNAAVQLPSELGLQAVLSLSQAQRLAKIELLRRRYWGAGTIELGLQAFAVQDFDVLTLTLPENGWSEKVLEVMKSTFRVITKSPDPGQMADPAECRLSFAVHETDSSIYYWSDTEELTIYDLPALPQQASAIVAAPTSLVLESDASTAIASPDGTVRAQIKASWGTPLDGSAVTIESQYSAAGSSLWLQGPTVSVTLNQLFIPGIVSGGAYQVQIRSVRPNGAASAWVGGTITTGLAINSQTAIGAGLGSLVADGYTSGNAGIVCNPFTAKIGQLALSIFPAGSVTITVDGTVGGSAGPLQQQKLYYVYYVDAASAGGNVTPIATTNTADFLGKNGYWLIDSIVTPYASSGGGTTATRWYPFSGVDNGSRTTLNPAAAYDMNLSTFASISGFAPTPSSSGDTGIDPTYGDFVVGGWQSGSSSSDTTLNVILAAFLDMPGGASGSTVVVNVTIGGALTVLLTLTASAAGATYSLSIPAGTDRSTIAVEVVATPGTPGTVNIAASASLFETYIQQ